MIWLPFTELTFLALFASERPREFARNPERVAAVAIAAERAHSAMIAQWPHHPRLLGGVIAWAILAESGIDEAVHDGSKLGLAGEVCLMQISPGNGLWQGITESREALAGVAIHETSL
jgi:hypothetical protein